MPSSYIEWNVGGVTETISPNPTTLYIDDAALSQFVDWDQSSRCFGAVRERGWQLVRPASNRGVTPRATCTMHLVFATALAWATVGAGQHE
jgi:hypothetical protein